jgi:hypothetical protein
MGATDATVATVDKALTHLRTAIAQLRAALEEKYPINRFVHRHIEPQVPLPALRPGVVTR